MNKITISKTLGFFAVFILALFLYSMPSHAGTISFFEIRDDANGGVCATADSGAHSWDADSKTCTLGQDISLHVTFSDNGLTLDCNGNTIQGTGSNTGIIINNDKNIVVKRCTIDDWNTGISASNRSSNLLIFKNEFTSNFIALNFNGVSNSKVIDNHADNTNTDSGFRFFATKTTEIINNRSEALDTGFSLLEGSVSNRLIANSSTGAFVGFVLTFGSARNEFIYNTATSHTGGVGFGFNLFESGREIYSNTIFPMEISLVLELMTIPIITLLKIT
ncbi:MAG TPA: right-handed parallel beta-helix repeat-containing protein [Thermodesulfobacteriota bacterium]|nr:right-handed parallel beta-helix repeat-containing protein [Thermodesulfobacteriota bacterium]